MTSSEYEQFIKELAKEAVIVAKQADDETYPILYDLVESSEYVIYSDKALEILAVSPSKETAFSNVKMGLEDPSVTYNSFLRSFVITCMLLDAGEYVNVFENIAP